MIHRYWYESEFSFVKIYCIFLYYTNVAINCKDVVHFWAHSIFNTFSFSIFLNVKLKVKSFTLKMPAVKVKPRNMEYKGDTNDADLPTIWLYLLCRRYSICLYGILLGINFRVLIINILKNTLHTATMFTGGPASKNNYNYLSLSFISIFFSELQWQMYVVLGHCFWDTVFGTLSQTVWVTLSIQNPNEYGTLEHCIL